jgi:hypothetical protein
VAVVDEVDETVARIRAHGPAPLLLDGWDRASIWGWDETTGSLYAHLWRNGDDPARAPVIRIGPDDFTPAISFPETLAQHIAMAAGCNPWKVLTALLKIDDQNEYRDTERENVEANADGTVVTMTQSPDTWWPPDRTV